MSADTNELIKLEQIVSCENESLAHLLNSEEAIQPLEGLDVNPSSGQFFGLFPPEKLNQEYFEDLGPFGPIHGGSLFEEHIQEDFSFPSIGEELTSPKPSRLRVASDTTIGCISHISGSGNPSSNLNTSKIHHISGEFEIFENAQHIQNPQNSQSVQRPGKY